MRYKELLEYKRDITSTNLGAQLIDAISFGVRSSLGATALKIKEIIPGIDISSGRTDTDIQITLSALGAHIHEILKFFEDADPTPNKQYTEWMIRRYIDGGIRYLEDVDSTVAENLAMYHELKIRRKLPPELADTGKVKSNQVARFFRDVYNIYKELPEVQERMIKGEAEQVYEDNEIKIIHPKNQEAACYYGQGTRWCTASTRSRNYFNDYNQDGPLYIVLPKKPKHTGEKYQLHFESHSYMNEDDASVDLYRLTKRFPQLHKLFHEQIIIAYEDGLEEGRSGTALLADPGTLENWTDIIEKKIKPSIMKELETPITVYNWLNLAILESRAKAVVNSSEYDKEARLANKKKIEWIDKIAEHISKNKDKVMEVVDRTIADLDQINDSLKNLSGGPTGKAMNAIPTMFPGSDTMETDIGNHYVSSDLRIKVMKEVWGAFTFEISHYFNDAFPEF